MNTYLTILLGIFLVVFFISVIASIIWILLIKSRLDKKLNMRDALLTSEEFEVHAKTTAAEHVVRKRRRFYNSPVLWMNQNYKIILSVYKELNLDIQKRYAVPHKVLV